MQQVINKMKKAPVVDENTGDYNLKYNMKISPKIFSYQSVVVIVVLILNHYQGLTYEDRPRILNILKNKLLSSLRIPVFLGYEEQIGSKDTFLLRGC